MIKVFVKQYEDDQLIAETVHEGCFASGFVVRKLEDGKKETEGFTGGDISLSAYLLAVVENVTESLKRMEKKSSSVDERTSLMALRKLIDLKLQEGGSSND